MEAGDPVWEPKLLPDMGLAGMHVKLSRGDLYGLHIVGECI